MDWIQIIQNAGVPAALLIYATIEGRKRTDAISLESREREARMAKRIDDVENFTREKLLTLNAESVTVIKQCTAALDRNSEVMDRFLRHENAAMER